MKQAMQAVDSYRQKILAALDYIWKNPETGYREIKTSAYMAKAFEDLGYTLTMAGDIPGSTDMADLSCVISWYTATSVAQSNRNCKEF